jgi:NADH dehydrogenase
MAEVTYINTQTKQVETTIGALRYDYLVIATGAVTNYYGNEQIKQHAIPIKCIDDAIALRNQILSNFEKALLSEDDEEVNSLMDYVIVGGGPTGVEVAGALAELKKHVFPKDYKELDFVKMDIHLIQGAPRLLVGMSEEAGDKALSYLEDFGVDVWLDRFVKSYDGYTVDWTMARNLLPDHCIWAAGVVGSPLDGIRKESILRSGRIKVDEFNRVEGYDHIFAVGDVAAMITQATPQGHPMMAPPAMQQGSCLEKM